MAIIKSIKKKSVMHKVKTPVTNTKKGWQAKYDSMINNVLTTRSELLGNLLDPTGRDLNNDCGYPESISAKQYHAMYEREGIAARVVNIWVEESWAMMPLITENKESEENTEFEKAFEEINKKYRLLHFISRVDQLSGIGRFGVLLLGIDDGLSLAQPIEGVTGNLNLSTKKQNSKEAKHQLIYLRGFEESVVTVATWENDTSNPRFGLPLMYAITFQDGSASGTSTQNKVHWSRIVHMADLRQMSEVYGTPRMQDNYNRLLDIRKILSGSGEMFWKGAFPGYSFEVDQDDSSVELDTASLREEMESYMNNLQRYLALTGVSVKSLAPQVEDPSQHFHANLEAICIAIGVPKRKFMGSEQGELASSQDTRTWNGRLKKRQEDYISPLVIRPVIDRLIEIGVLPTPVEYFIEWKDLNTQTDNEQADNAAKWAEAIAKYVSGGCEGIIAPDEFFSIFGNLSKEENEQIKKGLIGFINEVDGEHNHDIDDDDDDDNNNETPVVVINE